MAVSLELLTDEAILDYTRRGNKQFIITDHRDANLKYNPFQPSSIILLNAVTGTQ